MALHLKQERPDMLMLCDPSHIAGMAHLVEMVAQTALELKFDGLMVETHHQPAVALSDPKQQLDLAQLTDLLNQLQVKKQLNGDLVPEIQASRNEISKIDQKIIQLLGERMRMVQEIAQIKKEKNISVYQEKRWQELIAQHLQQGNAEGLNMDFIVKLFDSIHLESIDKQIKTVRGKDI
jgi:chorismate mutase